MPGFTHVPVTAYDVQRPTYLVRCTLTFVFLSDTLDITHIECAKLTCSRFLVSLGSPCRFSFGSQHLAVIRSRFAPRCSPARVPTDGATCHSFIALLRSICCGAVSWTLNDHDCAVTRAWLCIPTRLTTGPRPGLSGVKEQLCSPARVTTTVSDLLDTPLDWRRIAAKLPKHATAP